MGATALAMHVTFAVLDGAGIGAFFLQSTKNSLVWIRPNRTVLVTGVNQPVASLVRGSKRPGRCLDWEEGSQGSFCP